MLTIDRTACTGCGVCVDACLTSAISLDENEGVAAINLTLCDECLACLDLCPTDAIQRAASPGLVPVLEGEVVEGEVIGGEVIPAPAVRTPVTTRQPSQLAALSVVGSWLLPRAADALVGAVERWLAGGAKSTPSTIPLRSGNKPLMRQMDRGRDGRRRQRRRRRRGG